MTTFLGIKFRVAAALLAACFLGASCGAAPPATAEEIDQVQDAAAVEAEIWAKEIAIFEGRGRGDLSNYLGVTSDSYLGWPPVLKEPLSLDGFKASADAGIALAGEVITIEKNGFTMNGNTAAAYFTTHRTRLGDGMAPEGERGVDEYYENIHVWTLEEGEWRLIGGMARKLPPAEGRQ